MYTDTVARLAAVVIDHLELYWDIPPPETDAQGVVKEVSRVPGGCSLDLQRLYAPSVPEMASSSHCSDGSRSVSGLCDPHHRVLRPVLSDVRPLWSKVENLPQETPKHQMFRIHDLLYTHHCYDSVSVTIIIDC